MANYFNKPQLGKASLVNPQRATTPTVDRQAEYNAQLAAKQIDTLNQVGHQIIGEIDKFQKAKHKNEARRATVDMPSKINSYVKNKAIEDGVEFRDLSDKQLDQYVQEGKSKFFEASGINESSYTDEAYRMGEELSFRTLSKLTLDRNNENVEYHKTAIGDRVAAEAQSVASGLMSPEDFIGSLLYNQEDDVNAIANPAKSTGDFPEEMMNLSAKLDGEEVVNTKVNALASVYGATGNPDLLKILTSNEVKEASAHNPNFKNIVAMAKVKATKAIAVQQRQIFSGIEEQAHSLLLTGAIHSPEDVSSFLKDSMKGVPESLKPSNKSIYTLKNKMLKQAKTNDVANQYRKAIARKDATFLDSLEPKVAKEVVNNDFMSSTGITDYTPESLAALGTDTEMSLAFQEYADSGKPYPKALASALNNIPIGQIDEMEKQVKIYNNLVTLTQDKTRSINEIVDKKSLGTMLYLNNLLTDTEMSKAEKQEAYVSFRNDMNASVDSNGTYYSVDSKRYLNSPDIKEKIQKFSKDAPWTWDDNTSSSYIARDMKDSLARLMAAGVPEEELWDRAEENFLSSHKLTEAPDGSEIVLPREFMDVPEKKFITLVNRTKAMKELREASMFTGDFMWERRISWRPTTNYSKSKEMEMYLDGKRVEGTRFTRDILDNVTHTYEQYERSKQFNKLGKEMKLKKNK